MVHADVVIGLAGTLRVSFNASRIVIATQFAILRLCCRCHMAYQTMAKQHQQGDKASHDHCTSCVSPPPHHTRRADCMRALARSSRCAHGCSRTAGVLLMSGETSSLGNFAVGHGNDALPIGSTQTISGAASSMNCKAR